MATPAPHPWLLVSGDFVRTGGQDRCNHAVATYLADRGDEVHLAAHRASADLADRPNVTLHRAPKPLDSYLLAAPLLDRAGRRGGGPAGVAGGPGAGQWRQLRLARRQLGPLRPLRLAAGPLGGVAQRLKAAVAHRRETRLERARIGRARLVIANSERTRRDLVERLGVDPARIEVVYLGADVERFGPIDEAERAEARRSLGWLDDRPAVAFVGAMGDRRKGFDTLYEAWRRLAAGPSWDARLAVVGAGASLPGWRARASAEGLSGSIEFLGFRPDVPAVLAACDVLASPARYESYGLNVHEALCRGLPALASAGSGVAEQFPESLAALLLPDPDDAADLADRLRDWRSRRGHFREATDGVSRRLRARGWDVVAREVVAAIEATSRPGGDCQTAAPKLP